MHVLVSLQPMTQVSSKMRAVVSLVLSRQNCRNHRHIVPLGAHINTHRYNLMRKDHPNKAHSDMIRGACGGLTSSCDPDFKQGVCSGLTCSAPPKLYKPQTNWPLRRSYCYPRRWSNEKTSPNKAHSDIIRDACSGLTSVSDPVFK